MKIRLLKTVARLSSLPILVLFCVLSLNNTSLYAEVQGDNISVKVEFPRPKITPSTIPSYLGIYSHIEMQGLIAFGQVGEPVLPVKSFKVLIPQGKKIKAVNIALGKKVILPDYYLIEPGQRQYPLSLIDKIKPNPDKPKPEVYKQDAVYPANKHKFHAIEKKMGYPIATLSLCPVEYNPKRGEVAYYNSMSVTIRLEPDTYVMSKAEFKFAPRFRTETKAMRKDRVDIKRLIDNKDDLDVIAQALDTSPATLSSTSSSIGPISPGDYEHVIITSSALSASFEPLKQHRIQNGLTATIVTLEWIYANYPGNRPDGGVDNQTKIRNFIIDAYNNWGTRYVLLGGSAHGESPIIPVRYLYTHYEDNNIPSDLYYACLDGTFNPDSDNTYGEEVYLNRGAPEVDLLAEVIVGRAPVNSSAEVHNFIDKTIAYEMSAADSYLSNNYLLGEYLGFWGIADDATFSMEEIRLGTDAHGFITQGFITNPDRALDAKTLYETEDIPWSKDDLINLINNGVHVLNHLGHGNNDYLMKFNNADVDQLTNTKYFIVYSQACFAGAFDNRDFNAGYPPIHYFPYNCIAEHLTTNATGAVALVGNSSFGWGAMGSTAGVSQYFDRQFWDALFNEGITQLGKMNQDSKEDNLPYLYNFSPSGGILSFDTPHRAAYFSLNLLGDPALTVQVPQSPFVDVVNYHIFEKAEQGNGDGIPQSGEIIDLTVTLKALMGDLQNAYAALSTDNPDIIIEQSDAAYGTIAKGEEVVNTSAPFRFRVTHDYAPYDRIRFALHITADGYEKQKNIELLIPDPREIRITPERVATYQPRISGDHIVWLDERNRTWYGESRTDIYLYDLISKTEKRLTPNFAQVGSPAISGNYIAWSDTGNPRDGVYLYERGIYLYDITTDAVRRLTPTTSYANYPRISGDCVVWFDGRNGSLDIYLYNIATSTERRITAGGYMYDPDISGHHIVWQDGDRNIYLYDLSTDIQVQIANVPSSRPRISGNYVVWSTREQSPIDYNLYVYDIAAGVTTGITRDVGVGSPAISGNFIVWTNNYEVYLHNLSDGTTKRISSQWALACDTDISGNKVIWSDTREGYDKSSVYCYDFESPLLDPISNKTINEGALLQFTIYATDPNGDALTYSASNLPTGATFNPATRTFTWTPGYNVATKANPVKTYPNVHFEVRDGNGGTDSEDITITVNNANSVQLTILKNGQPPQGQPGGNPGEVGAFSSDLQQCFGSGYTDRYGRIEYDIPEGQVFRIAINEYLGPTIGWQTYFTGLYTAPYCGTIALEAIPPNIALTILDRGNLVPNYPVELEISWDGIAWNGRCIAVTDSSGIAKFRALPQYLGATSQYRSTNLNIEPFTVPEIGNGCVEITRDLHPNHPPVLSAINNKTVNEGQTLTFTVSATDADNDALAYSAGNLPTGATFNPETRTFTWTPGYDLATKANSQRPYPNVHFEVSDGNGGTDSENITITVINTPLPDIKVNDIVYYKKIWGQKFLKITFSNEKGEKDTGPFEVALYVNNSQRPYLKGKIQNIVAGKTFIYNLSISGIPNGAYTMKVVADSANQVVELNETNNSLTKTIVIK